MDLYIYYRVGLAQTQLILEHVSAMQAELHLQSGVMGSLKRRPLERDGCQTWMEIYPNMPDNFESLLEEAAIRHQLPSLLSGERHAEHFMDISPCV
ncbi:DUF4936 family protein [Herbaspirillum sp. RTI4]|uniref:DUF4936 family protein n=1 Tax=Herbaspirillum sp. RTI4 TaxID=3048640 RepID=UPI002AB456AF|nr:DUF4936 family protein [Herbaspirillum sp. RTI4]MDY7579090.1 DUF4936 family protein [Herbaspirillum sp. RTI4]MEA9981331.1 DUF4936 family protein [Herbaspirillum sp. RTI4]